MKNRTIVSLLAVVAAALLLTACVKDSIEIRKPDADKLQIAFTIPNQVPGTYATVGALPAEREFDEAYVIFYDLAGNYVAHASSNTHSSSSVGSFEVVKPAEVQTDESYKLLVVANMKYYLDPAYTSTSDYIETNKVLKYDLMKQEIKVVSNNRIARNLPMYAEADATLSAPGVISVIFERAVARFDFVSAESDLDIEWVKVCNYNNAGYLFHNDYNATGSAIIGGGGAGDVESNPKKVNLERRANMADPLAVQSNTNGGLYAFPTINVNTGINDQKTTCLLFKGTYSYKDDTGNVLTKEGYYRVNVCMPGKPQNLKRNNVYRITVKSVSDGGAGSEDEAMKNPTANVDYEINDWAVDNSQEVITDANGNYIVVSPTSAYIGGGKGSSLKGSIKVKNGSMWTIEKVEAGDTWFSVEKSSDNTGFILTALEDNTNANTRSSKVKVKVVGTALEYDIAVYQYSMTVSEDMVLIVDGRMGDFTLNVDGNGQTHKLQVVLGSNNAAATMSFESGDNTMVQMSSPSIGVPNAIGNNATINLVFRANVSGSEATSVYNVVRKKSGEKDISLKITFKQAEATEVIVPFPKTIFDQNSVDGFMNLVGAANITKCKSQRVTVTSRNLISYPKWKATSSFNTFDVALLTKPSAMTETYPGITQRKNVATGASNEHFDIAINRCGPGDETLSGTITIEACDANGDVVVDGPKYVIPLSVYSSLRSGFTLIGNLLWHDRNIGAPEATIGDESLITIPALPFSNSADDYMSKDVTGIYNNKFFKGTFHTWTEANKNSSGAVASPLCPPGWVMPSQSNITSLVQVFQWAKSGSWPYIVSNIDSNIGCYFPLSGWSGSPAGIEGRFWLDYEYRNEYVFVQITTSSITNTKIQAGTAGLSVRCLKKI